MKHRQSVSRFAIAHRLAGRGAAGVRTQADRLSSVLHASAEYRAHVVMVLARRALAQAG